MVAKKTTTTTKKSTASKKTSTSTRKYSVLELVDSNNPLEFGALEYNNLLGLYRNEVALARQGREDDIVKTMTKKEYDKMINDYKERRI